MRARLSTPHFFIIYIYWRRHSAQRTIRGTLYVLARRAFTTPALGIYTYIFHSRAVSTVMRAPRSPQNWSILCNVFFKNIDYYAALPLRHKIPFCAMCRSTPALSPFRAVAPLPRKGGYTPRGRRGRLTPINTLPRKARPD